LPNADTLGKIILNAGDLAAKPNIFAYSELPDFILAVGSGTINDSCRLASYRLNLPYGVVGTAPSMDGYASAGTPFLFNGSKATIQCTTPKYIIGDLDILKDAPFEMMLAGIGDMFGKYIGILDWELARDYSGEYFCDKIAKDVIDATDKCLKNGYELAKRDKECIKNVMEGFLVTGLGMAYTGNSRPASGSEHIIAHAWELYDIEHGNHPHLHGLEVCEATRLVAIMYKMLYKETSDSHLKELISKYIPYFDAVEEFCVKMNVPPTVTDRQIIIDGIHRALIMRDRYTILFYLRDQGKLEEYAEKATDALLDTLNIQNK
jgi:glycerol-1-phosphate dehydrogenase [NAD(P)+]